MDQQSKTLRFGAALIACSVLARLGAAGAFLPALDWFRKPETQAFLVYLETGRKVRFSPSLEEFENSDEDPQQVTLPPETEPAPEETLPVFSADAGDMTDILYACSARPDTEALLRQPLTWDLTGAEPKVLILHTHATESYTKAGEDYQESSAFRTLDEDYNMLSIGARVAALLEEGGIRVIHDTTLHDDPSYNDAYQQSREAARDYLEEYPSLCLILDIHRDAAEDSQGRQVAKTVSTGGRDIAQLMLVVGTDAGGLIHPNWRENMALAVKLHTQLEKNFPGICRPISFRSQRFNQDLSPGALIVEIGTAGNTRQEALLAAEVLAKSILDLSHGSVGAVTAGSTS